MLVENTATTSDTHTHKGTRDPGISVFGRSGPFHSFDSFTVLLRDLEEFRIQPSGVVQECYEWVAHNLTA